MTKIVTEKEFDAVISLPGAKRYSHFIKAVADAEELWSLGSDNGWALTGDDQGNEAIPIWPHERYVAACISDKWLGNIPRSIDLATWLQKWIPGMQKDGRLVAVFMTPNDKGVLVTPERLKGDLEQELLNFE